MHAYVQVLGELFHRIPRVREYPSRLMTADLVPLQDCLQPGDVSEEEPSEPFPAAGIYKNGLYQQVKGVKGNLVNVRPKPMPPIRVNFNMRYFPLV
jgi:hypothetical protein